MHGDNDEHFYFERLVSFAFIVSVKIKVIDLTRTYLNEYGYCFNLPALFPYTATYQHVCV